MKWTQAQRAEKMNPSVIREILKVTEKPGTISFAGALQYAASEGYAPLRDWIAASLPWDVDPAQVLITTGSQQALDLIAKLLIDKDSKVLVETPTCLGALQAFTPMEPSFVGLASDAAGVDMADLRAKAHEARFFMCCRTFKTRQVAR